MADTAQVWVDAVADQYVGPYMHIYFKKITTWHVHHILAFIVIINGVLEVAVRITPLIFSKARWLPINPRLHLDTLSLRDKVYIVINRISITVFSYHVFQVATVTPTVKWKVEEATLANTVLVLAPMFLLYDFVYTLFHKFLHLRCVYGYVHKHHHRQSSPSRGHFDAINVHPFEFLVGEYLNLLCIWMIPCHIFGAVLFVMMAGVIATLNHTRYDVTIPGVYDPKDHLVHHRLPDTNFGQYTMFWDKLYGWHHPWSDCLGCKGA
mmetsp:Transcript_79613/g.178085  ORF Transcript_79613/g.178085 Transcript_79613/m.178085 type:complete len:265 (-) Transcript_79613:81-875(-)